MAQQHPGRPTTPHLADQAKAHAERGDAAHIVLPAGVAEEGDKCHAPLSRGAGAKCLPRTGGMDAAAGSGRQGCGSGVWPGSARQIDGGVTLHRPHSPPGLASHEAGACHSLPL